MPFREESSGSCVICQAISQQQCQRCNVVVCQNHIVKKSSSTTCSLCGEEMSQAITPIEGELALSKRKLKSSIVCTFGYATTAAISLWLFLLVPGVVLPIACLLALCVSTALSAAFGLKIRDNNRDVRQQRKKIDKIAQPITRLLPSTS